MVSIVALLLPIAVSALLVFVASSLLHMIVPLHKADYRRLPAEAEVMDALRKFDIPPGDYLMPCPGSMKEMGSPEFKEKLGRGPTAVMTFYRRPSSMGPYLVQWFAYCLLVGVFAAYVAGRALPHGTPYLHVFRFAGVSALMCYWLALIQDSIWYHRSWGTTLRYGVDGAIYALLTAGTFGWLWPR